MFSTVDRMSTEPTGRATSKASSSATGTETDAPVIDLREPVAFSRRAAEHLDKLDRVNRRRHTIPLNGTGPRRTRPDGSSVVTFSSNDYLGLAAHPEVIAAAAAAAEVFGAGAGASRLVVGSLPIHHQLEDCLAAWKGTHSATLFPTGYSANIGTITTLASLLDPDDGVIISDELNHASLIDGIRLSGSRCVVVPHNDLDAYRTALENARRGHALVVVDSVFSMDGDRAPIAELDALCARFGALLMLDEAHETWPVAPPTRCETVRVGTLSKMLGSLGGFAVGPEWFRDLLVNTARPFIFSTAPTPAACGAAIQALSILGRDEGVERLDRLARNVDTVRPGHDTPIVPIVLGDETAALAGSAQLAQAGLLVPAIRPPTVPEGTSRLRVTLSADHTDAEVAALIAGLAELTSAPAR